jgi:hypothetical protein
MLGAIIFLLLVFGAGLLVGASELHKAWSRVVARLVGSAFLLLVVAAIVAFYAIRD